MRFSNENPAFFVKRLSLCWKRGLRPNDLRSHFILTWFALTNCNFMKSGRVLGFHRNNLIKIFKKEKIYRGSKKLRPLWKEIRKQYARRDFCFQFSLFFNRIVKFPILSRGENEILINLWTVGFPFKLIKIHYLLWAFRNGRGLKRVCTDLEITERNVYRIRYKGLTMRPTEKIWFTSLKPTLRDWFPFNDRVKNKVPKLF